MRESCKPILTVVYAILLFIILFVIFQMISLFWWFPGLPGSANPFKLLVAVIVSLIAFITLLYITPLILSRWLPKLSLKQKPALSLKKTARKTNLFQIKNKKLNSVLIYLIIIPFSLLLFFLWGLYIMSMFAF